MNDSTQPNQTVNAEGAQQAAAELQRQGNELMVLAESAQPGPSEGQADALRREAEALFAKAKEMGAEWIKTADEKTQHIRKEATDYTRENPMKAVGIAALFGLIVGFILKGKGRRR